MVFQFKELGHVPKGTRLVEARSKESGAARLTVSELHFAVIESLLSYGKSDMLSQFTITKGQILLCLPGGTK